MPTPSSGPSRVRQAASQGRPRQRPAKNLSRSAPTWKEYKACAVRLRRGSCGERKVCHGRLPACNSGDLGVIICSARAPVENSWGVWAGTRFGTSSRWLGACHSCSKRTTHRVQEKDESPRRCVQGEEQPRRPNAAALGHIRGASKNGGQAS